MQETSQLQARPTVFAGSFRIESDPQARSLLLVASGRDGRVEVRFQGVVEHALPALIIDPRIVQVSTSAGAGGKRLVAIHSPAGSWQIEADSLQVHEYPALFGRAVPLTRFRSTRRVLWLFLLWMARFRWGRVLIQRLTSRQR